MNMKINFQKLVAAAAQARLGSVSPYSQFKVGAALLTKTGEIIGGCCVGPSGGELIHEIVTAMAKRMTVRELAATPHYHPTLAEIWTYPAEELAEKI